ncbi:hypothetical protein K469DRAFT_740111 [Zopfia rhizophila CBS 207.26]|uniref:RTA1 like protein n=1 Tax=Zopfia rhizophila CBS 207.26 TaxID=1314779 RepID=A0A6A6DWY0_9PEZI|nr:hypothetical protein K469DRAFT_740111 [Zopfia rhizophila CBS 207.26]
MAAGNDHFQLYRHNPSRTTACIFIVLFILVTAIHLYHMLRTAPGHRTGPYVFQTLLLLIAPALFATSIYIMLGCIILLTDGETHSLIRKRWLTKIFGAGGGIMASGTTSALSTREHIVIGGLVLQLLFFGFFLLTRINVSRATTHVVSLLILVRLLFRLIEYAQGNDGYLMSHEVYMYIFDAVLILVTMCLLAWIHLSEVNALLKGSNSKAIHCIVSVYSLN